MGDCRKRWLKHQGRLVGLLAWSLRDAKPATSQPDVTKGTFTRQKSMRILSGGVESEGVATPGKLVPQLGNVGRRGRDQRE